MKKTYLVVGVVFLTLFTILFTKENVVAPELTDNNPISTNEESEVTFRGTLQRIGDECYGGGICYVMVDGQRVDIAIVDGENPDDLGQIIGSDWIGINHIGSVVEVYAKKVGNKYTLFGSREYYIKILNGDTSTGD